ncbi:MAG: hydroxymethylglutaryl-CoA lyase [Gammaproteobacteria bacterium]|nr:hydroxymethylglutaryl-CoA lyase [Gammaproteobacteria bacterium]
MAFPKVVKIVEVSPRDGLQNEAKIVPTAVKIEFIHLLAESGLSVIEATSFVSPKWIPQLADHKEVFQGISKNAGVSYPVLVPNLKGLQSAMDVGVKEIAIFTTPSEQFSQHNTNCSVAESLARIAEMMTVARQSQIRVRGYLSCVLGCPYEGDIAPQAVSDMAEKLIQLGCYEVSLGDTIGVGTPSKTHHMLDVVTEKTAREKLAVHFHDTYGQALANIYVALESGIQVIDSSVSGIGGCPYAKGASGNVASEDVLYMLNGMGIQTNVDLAKLIKAGQFISNYLQRPTQSKVNAAYSADFFE